MKLLFAFLLTMMIGTFAHADAFRNPQYKALTQPANIANGQTTSDAIPVGGYTVVGIQMPAAFTGTTITFTVATTLAGPYQPLYKSDGTALSVTVAGGRFIAIDPVNMWGVQFMKIVSGSAEAAQRAPIISFIGML